MKKIAVVVLTLLVLLCSCKKKESPGYVRFVFEHYWGDSLVNTNGKEYTTLAGQIITVEDMQYFITDLSVSGSEYVKLEKPDIRYIPLDSAYAVFLSTYPVKPGRYGTVSFIFGIDAARNVSGLFPNAPEKDMFWPDMMGGGYHYMKFDGKWKNPGDQVDQGFNLHLGALEVTYYDTVWYNSDSVIRIDERKQKYHKDFRVNVSRDFNVYENEITTVKIICDLKAWTEYPYAWDFAINGSNIMNSEGAMDTLAQNGRYVFR